MEYLLGSKKDFYDFVGSISKEDRVGIITHTDVDGLVSGIFLKKILETKGLKIDFIDFLNYGSDVLRDLSERRGYDKLFFTDWNADQYEDSLDLLREKGEVLIIDHHPVNEGLKDKSGIIKTDSSYCTSHTLFDLAKGGDYFDTKEWEWLVCAAIVADYCFKDEGVFEFLKSVYPEIEKTGIFESVPGINGGKIDGAIIYYADVRTVFELVLKKDLNSLNEADEIIRSEVQKWVEKFKKEAEYYSDKKLYFYYATPEYKISRIVATIVSGTIFPDSTIIFLSDKKSNEFQIGINSRNQTGNIDLGKLLKKCTEGFEDSSAGGHVKAAGGDFPKKYLEEFKKRVLEEL